MRERRRKKPLSFFELTNTPRPLSESSTGTRVMTKTMMALSPIIFLKTYALYRSLLHSVLDNNGKEESSHENEKLINTLQWVLGIVICMFFNLQNQIVTAYKFTPVMIDTIKEDIQRGLACCRRQQYEELDHQHDGSSPIKKIIDYLCWSGFSSIHGLFAYINARSIFGDSIAAQISSAALGVGFASILLPLRVAHGIDPAHHHDDDHDNHHHATRCSPKKIIIGSILMLTTSSVMLFEAAESLAFMEENIITHNISEMYKIALQHPYKAGALAVASLTAGLIETITEVDHVDAHVTLATDHKCQHAMNKLYAFLSALLAEHIEPFILLYTLGSVLGDEKTAILMGVVGAVLTGLDAYWTGEMHAYGIGMWQFLFQGCQQLAQKLFDNDSAQDEDDDNPLLGAVTP